MGAQVSYPVAEVDGRLVFAVDAAAALGQGAPRPVGCVCVACDRPLVLRAGSRRQPHFAHAAETTCISTETVLHATAIRVLVEAIGSAIADRRPWRIDSWCESCDTEVVGDLARHVDSTLSADRVLAERIRPDITLTDTSGRVRWVLEVIVTHAPEEPALDLYGQLGLPVIRVWPTWDNLGDLRPGLSSSMRREPWSRSGGYDVINAQCPNPRHLRGQPTPCERCGDLALVYGLEVSTTACWRCKATTRILDVIHEPAPGRRRALEASSPELVGIARAAAQVGVQLARARSQAAGTTYLMHHCGNCRAKLGDNFIYYGGESIEFIDSNVDHSTWGACANGHWTMVERRPWRTDGPIRRAKTNYDEPAETTAVNASAAELLEPSVTLTRVGKDDVSWVARKLAGTSDW